MVSANQRAENFACILLLQISETRNQKGSELEEGNFHDFMSNSGLPFTVSRELSVFCPLEKFSG